MDQEMEVYLSSDEDGYTAEKTNFRMLINYVNLYFNIYYAIQVMYVIM